MKEKEEWENIEKRKKVRERIIDSLKIKKRIGGEKRMKGVMEARNDKNKGEGESKEAWGNRERRKKVKKKERIIDSLKT